MAEINIGEIQKLVCVGGRDVAAIGTKGTYRFNWTVAHSRGRVDELGDVRLNALLLYGFAFPGGEDLADALPRGAVIPLPSEKRAKNWIKRGSGPRPQSRWFFESAIEAGFKPRYYLGESENPYKTGTKEYWYWHCESVYLREWPHVVLDFMRIPDGVDAEYREFLETIPDWQTRALVGAMVEDEFNNGEWCRFEDYLKVGPLVG